MRVMFRKWSCDVGFGLYRTGGGQRYAILLDDAETGERVAVATVNLPDEPLASNEVFIKDWSENEGILAVLVKAGVVQDTGRTVAAGFVRANVCKLLVVPSEVQP